MLASKKTYFGTKVVSRLHSRETEQLLSKEDKNRSSFVQNMELQRSLTLVNPGGFLFRLNKLKDNTTKNRRQNRSATVLQGKTISSDFKVSENKRDLFVRNSERQDHVASIIKQSILQRQTHSLAAGKWKGLCIEGKTTFELKTLEDHRKGLMAEAYSRGFKEKVNLLPPVEKRKTKDELRLSELNLDFSKVLLRKPGVLNKNRTEGKFQREEYKTANNKNDNLKSIIPPPMTTAPDSPKKRTIIVFLPVVSADEQSYQ